MALTVIQSANADLNRVQQNVKKELDAIAMRLPSTKTPSTPIVADYTVRLTDVLVLARPPADINVTLPEASTCVARQFTIKNLSGAAVVSLRGLYVNGAFQQVDGEARYDVPAQTSVSCYSDGFAWWVI